MCACSDPNRSEIAGEFVPCERAFFRAEKFRSEFAGEFVPCESAFSLCSQKMARNSCFSGGLFFSSILLFVVLLDHMLIVKFWFRDSL